MVLKKWDDEQATDYTLNAMNSELLSISGLNLIRMLIDRDIDFSAGNFDWWGDAYIDSNGRENSVSAATANYSGPNESMIPLFQTTGAAEGVNDTSASVTEDNEFTVTVTVTAPTIVTAVRGFNDYGSAKYMTATIKKDGVTIASKSASWGGESAGEIIFTDADFVDYWTSTSTNTIFMESGGSTDSISIDYSFAGYSGTLFSLAAQKMWVKGSGNELEVTEVESLDTVVTVTQDIPTGSFSATITEAIGVPFVDDWETGDDIKYKLTGTAGAEDTGWLDCGITPEISTFTAFTAEPDTLIVQLTPKSSSTLGYPSIKGFVVRAT